MTPAAADLHELDTLVRFLERQADGMRCSILLLEGDRLRHGAAPSLPDAYCGAIDGITIGPAVGSCGTAAFRRAPVVVTDIARDPLWADFRTLAAAHGLAACWSTPILGRDGTVLGTFAMYYGEPRAPGPQHEELVATATLLAGALIERARVADALQQERDAARAASRAKTQFLATMSHELRTPLNAIGGFTDLLLLGLRGTLNERQRADIERIRQSQEHLLRLITDMLNLTKIEAGAVEYRPRDVPMTEAFALLESITDPLVRERRLRLRLERPDPALAARVDPDKLQQILVNLLSNALKFTEPGGTIEVRCARAGGDVCVTVSDTGIGIPADRIEHIFDPFVQVDGTHSRKFGGVGLGLAISRDLARGMGGELTVASALGEGSVFTLVLPAARGIGSGELGMGRLDAEIARVADRIEAPSDRPTRADVRTRDDTVSP